jgi:hypothetical protein
LNAAKGDSVGKSAEVKPELIVSAMAGVFILGLVAITMLLGVMKSVLNLNVGQILAFAFLSFSLLIMIEGVFIRLLFRRKRPSEEATDAVRLKGPATNQLDAAQARGLSDPVPSVTEHTTRAFDSIYGERKSK